MGLIFIRSLETTQENCHLIIFMREEYDHFTGDVGSLGRLIEQSYSLD